MSSRFIHKIERELYNAADGYVAAKSHWGFRSDEELDDARRRLRRAARAFVVSEASSGIGPLDNAAPRGTDGETERTPGS